MVGSRDRLLEVDLNEVPRGDFLGAGGRGAPEEQMPEEDVRCQNALGAMEWRCLRNSLASVPQGGIVPKVSVAAEV